MGLRTVAGRLGLGLGLAAATARQKISGLPLCRRSFSSTSTATARARARAADAREMKGMEPDSGSGSEMELEFNKSKSLYLCFCELSRCGGDAYINRVVRPIILDNNTPDNDQEEEEEYLTEAAYKRSKVNWHFGLCGRFGSRILFPSGRHISWIDTSKQPMKFQDSSPRKTKIKSFSSAKLNVLLGELNGKLYCINNDPLLIDPHFCPFEVLDQENDPKWHPLDAPPFIRDSDTNDFDAAFLEGTNKILGWALLQPGVFCFDATKPETGWKESPSSLSNTLPFMDYGRPPFFIHHHHPTLGAFHLMFTYAPHNTPLLVNIFFMSDNCDSFHLINTPLQLPEWCLEYHHFDYPESGFLYEEPPISTAFEFVHLGEKKFCLVLNKFFSFWNTGILLLMTFEYDIIAPVKDSKSTLDIQTRLLGTRRLRYHSRQLRKPYSTRTSEVILTGAYQL